MDPVAILSLEKMKPVCLLCPNCVYVSRFANAGADTAVS